MRNTSWVLAAIALCAGPSAVMAFPGPARLAFLPALQAVNGQGVAPQRPGLPQIVPLPLMPAQQQDGHDTIHGVTSVLHAGHVFAPHGQERAPVFYPTRLRLPEAPFNPSAARSFACTSEFAPSLRASESAVEGIFGCAKGILKGIGAALAAISAVLFGKGKKESE